VPRPGLIHDPKRVKLILEAVQAGVPMKTAAEAAGITYDTLNGWRRRGADAIALADEYDLDAAIEQLVDTDDDAIPLPDGIPDAEKPYAEFFVAVRRARAQGLAALVVLWRQQARVDWRAARALLAVHDPATYAQRSRLDMVTSGGSLDALPPGEGDAVVERQESADIERAAEVLSVLADNGLLDMLELAAPATLPVELNGHHPVIDVPAE
jgi:hypothetical protein